MSVVRRRLLTILKAKYRVIICTLKDVVTLCSAFVEVRENISREGYKQRVRMENLKQASGTWQKRVYSRLVNLPAANC